VYSSAITDPPAYSLRVGCIEERAQLRPKKQIWCDSSLPWSGDIRNIETSRRQ
jgi:hypothetical protein